MPDQMPRTPDFAQSYEQVYQFGNLYRAYRAASKGKRDEPAVMGFGLDLPSNIWRLHDELESGTYRISGYYRFKVYDPKERDIMSLHFRDRVVQHSLCDNVLRPWFERRLIYDCAACRVGKGTAFAEDRLEGFLRRFYAAHGTQGHVLKVDVRKYFENIDHAVLKRRLERFPDPRVRWLMHLIIDSCNPDTGKGLPLGNQTSQWFALYYLDPIDRIIKERHRIKYYTRYMDDLVLVHESRAYLRLVLHDIRRYALDELGLELNDKTQTHPLSQGVEYLGWRFYLTDTGKVIKRLRASNKRRFKRRLKRMQKAYACGEMELDAIMRSLASYNGHLDRGDTWHLRQRTFRDFVLARGSGEKALASFRDGS